MGVLGGRVTVYESMTDWILMIALSRHKGGSLLKNKQTNKKTGLHHKWSMFFIYIFLLIKKWADFMSFIFLVRLAA